MVETSRKREKLTDSNDLLVGKRLRYLRESNNYTIKNIVELFGINETVYAKYENSYNMPTGRVIRKFAQFYNVSADYILGLIDIPIPIPLLKSEKRED